jgi:hypothetical protein
VLKMKGQEPQKSRTSDTNNRICPMMKDCVYPLPPLSHHFLFPLITIIIIFDATAQYIVVQPFALFHC